MKKTVTPFFAAAEGALAAMRNINSAINAGIEYDAYSGRVLELAAKADELERVEKETGLLSKDPDAEKLCSIMLLIAEDHNLARTYWKSTFATVADEPDYWASQRFGITETESLELQIKAEKAVADKHQRGKQNLHEMWDKVPVDSETAEGVLKVLKKRYGLR